MLIQKKPGVEPFFVSGTPTIKNCHFENNYAKRIWRSDYFKVQHAQPGTQIEDCTFTSNWAYRGGAVNLDTTIF